MQFEKQKQTKNDLNCMPNLDTQMIIRHDLNTSLFYSVKSKIEMK